MGRSFVQLIVGKTGIDDATALLDSFDLDICKCAITANRFIIPRPFQTFLFETMLQPALKSLLHKFIEAWDAEMTPINDRLYYSGPFPAIPEPVNAFNIIHSIPASVRLAVGFATLTSELTETECSGRCSFVLSTFSRILKYRKRGIPVMKVFDIYNKS